MDTLSLLKEYRELNLSNNIDYDKFNRYAIVHHSTSIEGSTLTEAETRLLLDEGLTPKGKPLEHSLMTTDHFKALLSVTKAAQNKEEITALFVQQINALVMTGTGKIYTTVFGDIDSSKGMFRKGNVSAGDTYFVNYDMVEPLTVKLCETIRSKIPTCKSITEQLNLSFDAHFDLITIHPFYDGNGRTSRLLMNYVQLHFGLPMSIVFKEDKSDYIKALTDSRAKEDLLPFREFMYSQYHKFLQQEINAYNTFLKPKNKGKGFSLVF